MRKLTYLEQFMEKLFFQDMPEHDIGKCLTDSQAKIKFRRNTRQIQIMNQLPSDNDYNLMNKPSLLKDSIAEVSHYQKNLEQKFQDFKLDIYKRRVNKFRRDVDRGIPDKDHEKKQSNQRSHLAPKIFYQSKMKDLEKNEKYIRGQSCSNQLNIIG